MPGSILKCFTVRVTPVPLQEVRCKLKDRLVTTCFHEVVSKQQPLPQSQQKKRTRHQLQEVGWCTCCSVSQWCWSEDDQSFQVPDVNIANYLFWSNHIDDAATKAPVFFFLNRQRKFAPMTNVHDSLVWQLLCTWLKKTTGSRGYIPIRHANHAFPHGLHLHLCWLQKAAKNIKDLLHPAHFSLLSPIGQKIQCLKSTCYQIQEQLFPCYYQRLEWISCMLRMTSRSSNLPLSDTIIVFIHAFSVAVTLTSALFTFSVHLNCTHILWDLADGLRNKVLSLYLGACNNNKPIINK